MRFADKLGIFLGGICVVGIWVDAAILGVFLLCLFSAVALLDLITRINSGDFEADVKVLEKNFCPAVLKVCHGKNCDFNSKISDAHWEVVVGAPWGNAQVWVAESYWDKVAVGQTVVIKWSQGCVSRFLGFRSRVHLDHDSIVGFDASQVVIDPKAGSEANALIAEASAAVSE